MLLNYIIGKLSNNRNRSVFSLLPPYPASQLCGVPTWGWHCPDNLLGLIPKQKRAFNNLIYQWETNKERISILLPFFISIGSMFMFLRSISSSLVVFSFFLLFSSPMLSTLLAARSLFGFALGPLMIIFLTPTAPFLVLFFGFSSFSSFSSSTSFSITLALRPSNFTFFLGLGTVISSFLSWEWFHLERFSDLGSGVVFSLRFDLGVLRFGAAALPVSDFFGWDSSGAESSLSLSSMTVIFFVGWTFLLGAGLPFSPKKTAQNLGN